MKQKLQNLKMRLKSKGSILAFTLIILFIMLATALSIAGVTVIERKTSTSTGKSTASFQIADSGTEIFLKRIKDGTGTLSSILGPDCAPGTNSVTGSAGSGSYTITFYDSSTPTANQLDCGDNVSDIDHIKSVGTLSGTSRAVEVAVAQGQGGIIGGCGSSDTHSIIYKWGQGCKDEGTSSNGCEDVEASGYDCGYSAYTTDGDVGSYCICIKI